LLGQSLETVREVARNIGVEVLASNAVDLLDQQILLVNENESGHDPECLLCNPPTSHPSRPKYSSIDKQLRNLRRLGRRERR
jgi:hypothetical protein